MEIDNLYENTMVILKAGDLQKFAEKLTGTPAPAAPLPSNDLPIPQPEAIKVWHTTRQRLATLRRLGLLEALELNGRIYYRPQAFTEAMRSLKGTKRPLL